MSDQAWTDSHYPRCARCGLRTYVSNLTGARCAEVTGTAECAAYNLPESERPEYPYVDSLHTLENGPSQVGQTPSESIPPVSVGNDGNHTHAQWLAFHGHPGYSEDFAIMVHGQWEAQGGGIAEAIDAVRFERS